MASVDRRGFERLFGCGGRVAVEAYANFIPSGGHADFAGWLFVFRNFDAADF